MKNGGEWSAQKELLSRSLTNSSSILDNDAFDLRLVRNRSWPSGLLFADLVTVSLVHLVQNHRQTGAAAGEKFGFLVCARKLELAAFNRAKTPGDVPVKKPVATCFVETVRCVWLGFGYLLQASVRCTKFAA